MIDKIKIIYEDNHVLVVDKPADLAVHPDEFLKAPTLVDWLLEKYPEIKNVGEDKNRPGIVHRLDKDTSGVMIVAKNQKSFEFLKKQFQNREVKKTYLTLVHGNFKDDEGIIDRPIGKSPKDSRLRFAGSGARGDLKEAVTEYKVLERFKDVPDLGDVSLLEVYPKTGRTHQIRVHLQIISHPVVCDKLYAKNKFCPAELGRQFLHAKSLEIKIPPGEQKNFEVDLPKELKDIISDFLN